MNRHRYDSADDYAASKDPRAEKITAWLETGNNLTRVLLDRVSDIYEVLSPMARMKLHALMIFCYYDLPPTACMQQWFRDVSALIIDEGDESLMQADPDPIIKLCLIADRKPFDMPAHLYMMMREVDEIIEKEMIDQELVENTAASMMGI